MFIDKKIVHDEQLAFIHINIYIMTFIFIVIWLLSVASAAETPFRVQSGSIQTKPKIL